MKIAKYIGDLLYDYECVVIPGLGGFLTNEKPASIHPVTHHFRPPYKQVMFNSFLKTNDGLLLNYIAREEGVSYKEAKEQLDHFVLQCHEALKNGKRINFHRVGYLYLNKQEQISFEQDSSVNYDAEAFGLGAFVSPVVRRPKTEERIREMVGKESQSQPPVKEIRNPKKHQPAARKDKSAAMPKLRATKQKSPYRVQLAFLSLLIFAMLVGWGFMNKDKVGAYYNSYSSVIPLFYSNSNAYLINNVDRLPVSKFSSSKSGLWIVKFFENLNKKPSSAVAAQPVQKAEIQPKVVGKARNTLLSSNGASTKEIVQPVKEAASRVVDVKSAYPKADAVHPKPVYRKPAAAAKPLTKAVARPAVSGRHYYILAGSFKDRANALRLVHQLQSRGFRAVEAGITPSGLHRVAFGVYDRREFAEQKLLAIRQRENPSAWILEK
jgi:cell division septation protein DedD